MTAEILPFPSERFERVVAALIRSIVIVSRDEVTDELVGMVTMLGTVQDLRLLRAIRRIDCDSRAPAVYEVQLHAVCGVSPKAVSEWLERAAMAVHEGHNGITVEAPSGESSEEGAFWIGDDDVGLQA